MFKALAICLGFSVPAFTAEMIAKPCIERCQAELFIERYLTTPYDDLTDYFLTDTTPARLTIVKDIDTNVLGDCQVINNVCTEEVDCHQTGEITITGRQAPSKITLKYFDINKHNNPPGAHVSITGTYDINGCGSVDLTEFEPGGAWPTYTTISITDSAIGVQNRYVRFVFKCSNCGSGSYGTAPAHPDFE